MSFEITVSKVPYGVSNFLLLHPYYAFSNFFTALSNKCGASGVVRVGVLTIVKFVIRLNTRPKMLSLTN